MKKTKLVSALLSASLSACLLMAPANAASQFSDVSSTAWYADAVQWAYDSAVTFGDGAGHFNPDKELSNGQAIQFIYNINATDFEDSGEYWYSAAQSWGIKYGYITADTDMLANCSRLDFVKMYYTAEGSPEPTITNPFTDTTEKAAIWAYETGLTSGDGKGHFMPDDILNRATVVQFLYNSYTGHKNTTDTTNTADTENTSGSSASSVSSLTNIYLSATVMNDPHLLVDEYSQLFTVDYMPGDELDLNYYGQEVTANFYKSTGKGYQLLQSDTTPFPASHVYDYSDSHNIFSGTAVPSVGNISFDYNSLAEFNVVFAEVGYLKDNPAINVVRLFKVLKITGPDMFTGETFTGYQVKQISLEYNTSLADFGL